MLVVENLVEADAVERGLSVQLYMAGGALMISINDRHGCVARLAIPADADCASVVAERASGKDARLILRDGVGHDDKSGAATDGGG